MVESVVSLVIGWLPIDLRIEQFLNLRLIVPGQNLLIFALFPLEVDTHEILDHIILIDAYSLLFE